MGATSGKVGVAKRGSLGLALEIQTRVNKLDSRGSFDDETQ